MNKILRIEEAAFKTSTEKWASFYAGYQIITDAQTIKIGISQDSSCCEQFGYLTSEDNFADYTGAEIVSITRVDEALNSKIREFFKEQYMDAGEAMFININTTKGLLQFVVYNSHNGYYSHEVVVISQELNITESL